MAFGEACRVMGCLLCVEFGLEFGYKKVILELDSDIIRGTISKQKIILCLVRFVSL